MAEREPCLAERDVEDLFEVSDLRDLHADDGAFSQDIGDKLGSGHGRRAV
jgi:hypothetical protein